MRSITIATVFVLCLCTAAPTEASCGSDFAFGVNIHFADPDKAELARIAAAGATWVRTDFVWGATEPTKGIYTFDAYDKLLAALDAVGLRPIWILDYWHPQYDDGRSPSSPAGQRAFAEWAAAAARHFRDRGVVWEIYNEPNTSWKPTPNTNAYVTLAAKVGDSLRRADPKAIVVGPATARIDLPFLEACFKAGVLAVWSAVTVHPYRPAPESAMTEYAKLRSLIARYAPKDRCIDIWAGEWGYASTPGKTDEMSQARLLVREVLLNAVADVPVTLWYDWRDDGTSPTDPEHHFGLCRFRKDGSTDFSPKPAYLAARTVTSFLKGQKLVRRIPAAPDDFIAEFSNGTVRTFALWTTGAAKDVLLSVPSGRTARIFDFDHSLDSRRSAGTDGLSVHVSDEPLFVTIE